MAYGLKPSTNYTQGLAGGVQGFMQGRQMAQQEDDRAYQRGRIEKADARAEEQYNYNLGLRPLQEKATSMQMESSEMQLNETRRKLEQEGLKDLWRYARNGMLDEGTKAFNAAGGARITGAEYHPDDPNRDYLILHRPDGQAATIDLRKLDQMYQDPKDADRAFEKEKIGLQHKNKLGEIEAEAKAKAAAEGGLGLRGGSIKTLTGIGAKPFVKQTVKEDPLTKLPMMVEEFDEPRYQAFTSWWLGSGIANQNEALAVWLQVQGGGQASSNSRPWQQGPGAPMPAVPAPNAQPMGAQPQQGLQAPQRAPMSGMISRGQSAAPAPVDPAAREVGKIYTTPTGNYRWMGNGWAPQ